MSGRLFKKVLQEQEQSQLHKQHQHEEDTELVDESESPNSAGRSFKNPFDLLNEDDDDDIHEEDDALEPVQVQEIADRTLIQKHTTKVASTSNKSKKKKKKKGKESANLTSNKTDFPVDLNLETLSLDANSSIRESATEESNPENIGLSSVKKEAASVLLVDPKYLNVDNELRRIFGAKVVRSFEKSNRGGSSRQVRGGRPGIHHMRKTVLISQSDHWPRWDGSFSMEFLETKNGYHYFRYVHSASYDQAQRAFQAAQALHDLNGVTSVLMNHPYHLDSLVTMSDYFRLVGEHQVSADLVGKTLYGLECAWHPMFTPFLGNCQLKFHEETNKPLFTSLFTHMKNMDKRGCHRSALEVCKLLLSLDSDDPMGALFCIDYYAVRAGEYAWLAQFSEEYKSDNSLWLFPNFSYALAVARFYIERENSSQDNNMDVAKATSVDLMKQALMLHPSVLKKLVEKVPLKDQAWTKILKHSFFSLDKTKIPSLDHLISIYVERSYLIWRLPDLQKLLREAAQLVIETLEHDESEGKDWACVRKEAFPSEKNEYSHLLVQDFSDSVPTLPPDNLQNFVMDPRMAEQGQMRGQNGNPLEGGHVPPPRDIANRNPFAVLFESLLPWVHYGNGDGAEDGDVNQFDGHGQGNEDH